MATKGGATAIPAASVKTVTAYSALVEKVPLAPLVGARNVTGALATGLVYASSTVTARPSVKAEPTGADCTAPSPAVMLAGPRPALVREKVTLWGAGFDVVAADVATTVNAPATPLALDVTEAEPLLAVTSELGVNVTDGPPAVVSTE